MTTEVFYRNNCIKVIWNFNGLQLHLLVGTFNSSFKEYG